MPENHPLQQTAYPPNSSQPWQQVQAELRSQRELLEAQHHLLKSIRRSMRVSSALSLLRFALVLVPLVLALIYLPPLIRQWMGVLTDYQEAFSGKSVGLPQGIDLQQLQQLLQKSGLLER